MPTACHARVRQLVHELRTGGTRSIAQGAEMLDEADRLEREFLTGPPARRRPRRHLAVVKGAGVCTALAGIGAYIRDHSTQTATALLLAGGTAAAGTAMVAPAILPSTTPATSVPGPAATDEHRHGHRYGPAPDVPPTGTSDTTPAASSPTRTATPPPPAAPTTTTAPSPHGTRPAPADPAPQAGTAPDRGHGRPDGPDHPRHHGHHRGR